MNQIVMTDVGVTFCNFYKFFYPRHLFQKTLLEMMLDLHLEFPNVTLDVVEGRGDVDVVGVEVRMRLKHIILKGMFLFVQ